MHQKVDLLEAQLRRMTSDPRPSDFNRCYECDGEGHFGRDCPDRAMKLARREAAKAAAMSGAATRRRSRGRAVSAETRRHCRPHFESDERLETCAALPSVNKVAPRC